ncbi:LacI family DNA-binding transcriptional regulator [Demequina maris]|uniref:LacI family DNA-binding transcriptional regulator n=1 Tax=Demequina maris TaxID=1638982 RepID=UPI0007830450|nr:LacI family DNA-binding transcriptional regulator [Demequina maris]
MATLSDIARVAGVSVSAVSRVLSGAEGTRVSDETRARIHQAALDLDYRPNYAARALKLQRTSVLACIVPDLTNAMFSDLLSGIESRARELDFTVLLSRAEALPELDASLERLLGEGRVDGAIVQTLDAEDPTALRALSKEGMPVVFVNTVHPDHVGSVILDDEEGAATATRHLLELGHSRIGFIGGLDKAGSARRRLAGFEETMRMVGLPVNPAWVTADGYRPAEGASALARIAALDDRPTALVVANINAAMGALLEARRRGWHVPTELSLVSVHDSWPAAHTWPPLTTVKMPLYEMGRAAVDQVTAKARGVTVADEVIRAPRPALMTRGSSAEPPIA